LEPLLAHGPPFARADDALLVQALARGLELLRAFTQTAGPLGNREIARLSGLPKATVSRLTYTLARLGYLDYDPALGKYQPGIAAVAIGHRALQAIALRGSLRPWMEEIAASFPVTVSLVARDRLRLVLLARMPAPPGRGSSCDEPGSSWPLSLSGLARGLIVGLPQAERHYVLDYLERADPLGWPGREREIYQALAEYQHQGYTIATGDESTGAASPPIPAVCVPLRTSDGAAAFGLGCSSPAYRLPKDRLVAELGPRLAELAGRVRQGGLAL
jgi:DNA-binding IclR family transcriptional regulator